MPQGRQGRRWGRSCQGVCFLEPTLLLLLHYGPAHGYTLIEQLATFGMENPHSRIVYRMLRDMEENEWVTSAWDTEQTQGPPRRVYQLTALGDEMLSMCMRYLKQMRVQIDEMTDSYRQHMQEGQGEHH